MRNTRQVDADEEARVETAKRKAELEEGFLATSSTRPGRARQDEASESGKRSLGDVVVEKSNVLMMSVIALSLRSGKVS